MSAIRRTLWRRRHLTFFLASLLMLIAVTFAVKQAPLSAATDWSSTWQGMFYWLNQVQILFGPVSATLAAWFAGAERRSRARALLQTVSRPSHQRRAVEYSLLLACIGAAVVGAVVLYALAASPALTYWGGRWPIQIVLVALGTMANAAVGYLVGSFIPGRLVAPLVGLALYVAYVFLNYMQQTDERLLLLAPVTQNVFIDGLQPTLSFAAVLVLWYMGIVSAVFVVTSYRRWQAVAGAGAFLVAGGAALVSFPMSANLPVGQAVDSAARELDCSASGVVCLWQVHAALRPSFEEAMGPEMLRLQGLTGAQRFVEGARPSDPSVIAIPNLQGYSTPFARQVSGTENIAQQLVANAVSFGDCGLGAAEVDNRVLDAQQIAFSVIRQDQQLPTGDSEAIATFETLRGDETAATAWIRQYRVAAAECNVPTLIALSQGSAP